MDGNNCRAVRKDQGLFACSTRQRAFVEFRGAERIFVLCRAWLQMARASRALRQLAQYLRAHESLGRNDVLDRVFEKLQLEQIVRIKIEAFSLDSTIVKVHPDGTGALKKRAAGHRQIPRRMDYQDSSGCRECSNGHNPVPIAGQRARCAPCGGSCCSTSNRCQRGFR
jgi:hypothetical protein